MRNATTLPSWTILLMIAGCLLLMSSRAGAQAGIDPTWDHYRVYQATPNPGTAPPVILEDQFGVWNYSSPQLGLFANPDQKTHDGVDYPINNPRLHYTWWYLGSESFAKDVQVENQFGPQMIHVGGVQQYLLNPATKNENGPIPVANHYKCYDCGGVAPNVTVVLQDQFSTRTVVVGRPIWLCNPTKKTVAGVVYDIVDPNQHYVCYAIDPDPTTYTAFITDQFVNEWDLNLTYGEFICVPSLKFDPTQEKGSTWGRMKTLYR